MAWVLLAASFVALVQAAAWLGPAAGAPRSWRGTLLGIAGAIGFGVALLHLLVPGFFTD